MRIVSPPWEGGRGGGDSLAAHRADSQVTRAGKVGERLSQHNRGCRLLQRPRSSRALLLPGVSSQGSKYQENRGRSNPSPSPSLLPARCFPPWAFPSVIQGHTKLYHSEEKMASKMASNSNGASWVSLDVRQSLPQHKLWRPPTYPLCLSKLQLPMPNAAPLLYFPEVPPSSVLNSLVWATQLHPVSLFFLWLSPWYLWSTSPWPPNFQYSKLVLLKCLNFLKIKIKVHCFN